MARLPVLDPCGEDYEAMRGAGTTRFCDRCSKNVTNLSDMTRVDAKRFLEAHAGERVCVRYRSRAGVIQFKPPTVARLGFVAALSLALAACTGYVDADELDSPGDALVCHDAYGYAVPCEEVDEGVIPLDDSPPAGEDGGGDVITVEVEPEPPVPPPTEVVEADDLMGVVAVDPEVGCPVPTPDITYEDGIMMGEVAYDEQEDYMGGIEAPSRGKLRRAEREERREDRRAARAERRLARRQR